MGIDLEERFGADFTRFCLTHPGVVLHLSGVQAWSLMAGLQLACRHPEWHGATRDIVESIARMLEEALATTPALREIAKMGWRPECDVEDDFDLEEADPDGGVLDAMFREVRGE